jgi:hypothetical protein
MVLIFVVIVGRGTSYTCILQGELMEMHLMKKLKWCFALFESSLNEVTIFGVLQEFYHHLRSRAGGNRRSEKGANMYAKSFIQGYMKVVAQINKRKLESWRFEGNPSVVDLMLCIKVILSS